MYAKITTDACILSMRSSGEGDRVVDVYTRELGMIRGVVKSVRKHTAKHKATFLPYGISRIDIIRGRDVWRLTSGIVISSYQEFQTRESRVAWARVAELVKRLCPSDGAHGELFDYLVQMRSHLLEAIQEEVPSLEVATVMGVLVYLGYYDSEFFTSIKDINSKESILGYIGSDRIHFIQSINNALRVTGL